MAKVHSKPHAIMISLPYQGHLNPFVNLALKLASKGIVITFVHLESTHHSLSEANHGSQQLDIFSKAQNSGLDIRYTTIDDGFSLEYDRTSLEYWEFFTNNFPALVDEFVGKMIQQADPHLVHFMVADSVSSWPATIAQKYNMVNVSFWTQPALTFSLLYHLDLLRLHGHFPCKDDIEEDINYLPGIKSINTKDLMPFLKESEKETIVPGSLALAFEGVKQADFILHNTVHELESETISALNKTQPNYTTGPVNFFKNLGSHIFSNSLRSESDCTNWLNSKPPASVLYISFGSVVEASKQVVEELTSGLLLSEVNFIWVVRDNILPDGFEEGSKNKGLIVPWCNQITVLSNPAIGGFLTHCGWNSIVESIWCGVPIVCCPVNYDQPTNRKLMVDDWKIGIDIYDDGMSMNRKRVAEKIKSFMNGTEKQRVREEMKKVSTIFRSAVDADGSSERNFDRFVQDLKAKMDCK